MKCLSIDPMRTKPIYETRALNGLKVLPDTRSLGHAKRLCILLFDVDKIKSVIFRLSPKGKRKVIWSIDRILTNQKAKTSEYKAEWYAQNRLDIRKQQSKYYLKTKHTKKRSKSSRPYTRSERNLVQ